MFVLNFLLAFGLINIFVNAKEYCPKLCVCDIFEGLKRADCSDQKLVNSCTNIPSSVEILNLSGNEITVINDECLKDYTKLINLSLAKNSVHTIEFFSFDGMEKLNYLDLSDNRLELIDNRIFEKNIELIFLDISKNKFMLLKDQPFLISSSLEILNIRSSNLAHIYNSFFTELPNLKELDISNNLLIFISTQSFNMLNHLKFINIEYNRFSCDRGLDEILHWMKTRGVSVKIDICVKNSKKPMFERMMIDPTDSISNERMDIDIDLVWKDTDITPTNPSFFNISLNEYYYKIINISSESLCDDDESYSILDNMTEICDIKQCHEKFKTLFKRNELCVHQKINIQMTVATVFYVALCLGIITGIILMYGIVLLRKKMCHKKNNKLVRIDDRLNRSLNSNLTSNRINLRNNQRDRDLSYSLLESQCRGIPRNSSEPILRNNNLNLQSNRNRQLNQRLNNCEFQFQQEQNSHNSDINSNSNIERHTPHRIYQYTPTAMLLQNLFRRRRPYYMHYVHQTGGPSSMTATTVETESSPISITSSNLSQQEDININEQFEAEANLFRDTMNYRQQENDDSSEYLSISNLSLNLSSDRCETPPPAYKSLYNEEEK